MSQALKRLQEKRDHAATTMRGIVDLAEAEDRGLTADERQEWDTANETLEGLEERIANIKRIEKAEAEAAEERFLATGNEDEEEYRETAEGDREEAGPEDRHSEAFGRLIRSTAPGLSGLSPEDQAIMLEQRAQGTSPDSAGGYTVPEGFGNRVIETMAMFSGIQQIADVLTTESGNDLPYPTNDDTGNAGSILAENTQDSEQDTVFDEVRLGAYKYTSNIVRVSMELLQDNAVDLETRLPRMLGTRIGRATAAHYATGTNIGQPHGLATAATSAFTAASGTALTWNELLDLKHSVDPAYRMGSPHWVFNDDTFKQIKQLVDGDSRPLWQPSIAGVAAATLDGDSYQIDQGMPNIALSSTPVVYGDVSQYLIRLVQEVVILRLVERYADFAQVGFVAFARTDADLLDTAAVRKVTMAAA